MKKRNQYVEYTTGEKIRALILGVVLLICSTFVMVAMFNPVAANPDAKWNDRTTMTFPLQTALTASPAASRDLGR